MNYSTFYVWLILWSLGLILPVQSYAATSEPLATQSAAAGSEKTIVDVLVVYTPGATERYGGDPASRIDHLFNVTNQIYEDSQVNMAINLVHAEEVPYSDSNYAITAIQDLTYGNGAFSNVAALREEHGADMVILYRPYHNTHYSCGVAWVGGYKTGGDFSSEDEKDWAFSHVAMDTCGEYVTVHELGHNMGLMHSRVQDRTGGTFDYALGHGEYGNFVTIMGYTSAYNVDYHSGKIYKLSSPELDCNGSPCGVNKDHPTQGADAVHTLSITGPQVSNYFESKQPDDRAIKLKQLKETWELAIQEYDAAYDEAVTRLTEWRKAKKTRKSIRRKFWRARKNGAGMAKLRKIINEYYAHRVVLKEAKKEFRTARRGLRKAHRTMLRAEASYYAYLNQGSSENSLVRR